MGARPAYDQGDTCAGAAEAGGQEALKGSKMDNKYEGIPHSQYQEAERMCPKCQGSGRDRLVPRANRGCGSCAATGRVSVDDEGLAIAWTRRGWVRA